MRSRRGFAGLTVSSPPELNASCFSFPAKLCYALLVRIPKAVLEQFRRAGSKGAAVRNQKLSPARRREIARLASRVRWDHYKATGKTNS